MAEQSGTFKIDHYLELVLKHRWLIIIPFCLSMVVGLYLAFALPRIYEASALVLVTPQRVPSDYVRSVVEDDIGARVSNIAQRILSSSNLKKLVESLSLINNPQFDGLYPEEIIANIRENVTFTPNRSRRTLNSFVISFMGPDPKTVMKITNSLANSFVEENMRVRETQAVGTSDFLDNELLTMRQRLEQVEQKLREYRQKYIGELPEQLQSNLKILETSQKQKADIEERLSDEKSRLIEIENQINARQELLSSSVGGSAESGESTNLFKLKNQLAELKLSYTEKHPDVIKLKEKIAELEEAYKNGKNSTTRSEGTNLSQSRRAFLADKTLADLTQRRAELRIEIRDIVDDIGKINHRIEIYRRRIEITPKREEELMTLNRDYKNIQNSYSSLLNRKLEAEISVNMEKKQKGEQIQVANMASLPRNPVSPDMKRLFLMTLAAGLGIGGALIILLDFLNTNVKQPEEIEEKIGITLLATIPRIYQAKDIRRNKIRRAATVSSLLVAACLFACFAAVVFIGPEPAMAMIRSFINPQPI